MPLGAEEQRAFQPGVPDYCMNGADAGKPLGPGWTSNGKSLADTLTLDRRGRVWWDYAREIDSVVRCFRIEWID